jgi:hypothetical protein
MGSDMPTDGRWLLQALSVHWYVLDALHAGPRRLRGVWGMTRDSRLSLLLHPCIIADFLTDDDPLAQELNKYQRYRRHSMSQDQRGRDQVPIAALPPVFAHIDIAEHTIRKAASPAGWRRTRRHPLERPAGGGTSGGKTHYSN